jgi:serine protease AprX
LVISPPTPRRLVLLALLLLIGLAAGPPPRALAQGPAPEAQAREKISPWLLDHLQTAPQAGFLVILEDQADLSGAAFQPTREARGRLVYDALRTTAERSQAPLRHWLDARGINYQRFYIVNMLWVAGEPGLVYTLAARPDVARVEANPSVRGIDRPTTNNQQPTPELVVGRASFVTDVAPNTVEWNISQVRAPDVWALGFTGQGIVVAGQDTGIDWDHPALINHYRGWNGGQADHDYNWHDAIHGDIGTPNTNPCGYDSPVPCDDYDHGTHTLGTVVGDDGAGNQIGMAPGARWIGCRNMDRGDGTPATYIECFEFFLAPYPVGGDPLTQGDPSLAPHVINNSWACPPSEGCDPTSLQATVEAVRAAGIEVIVSAGNSGSSCSTVRDPAAIYQTAFSVGATDSNDNIASFSSRGPVTVDGSGRMKPNISAPGVNVRSSVPGGDYQDNWSGTSMAAPHVAGAVALLWSAAPDLIGDVDATELILEHTAVPRTASQTCGGVPGSQVPNNTYGWGRLDVYAAVQAALNPCVAGDFDANHRVDAVDLQLMARCWRPGSPAEGFCRRYDLSGDGRIDIDDFQQVGTDWGYACTP